MDPTPARPEASDGSDVAGSLIAGLEAGAELVDQGGFTLSLTEAREKLASFRLADPQAFVLFLVELAHLLPQCTGIRFQLGRAATRVTLDGADLRADELRAVFDAPSVDLEPVDPEAARRDEARRRLAAAVDAVVGLSPRGPVELRSVLAGQRELRLDFRPGGEPTLVESPSSATESSLTLVVHEAQPIRARLGPREPRHVAKRRGYLYASCRWATRPVYVDDVQIDEGSPARDWVDPVEIVEASGRRVGHGVWSEATADAPAQVQLVANGVIIETTRLEGGRDGFLAVVEAGDLRRDLSQTRLVRDPAYERRVALAHAAQAKMQRAPPLRYRGPGELVKVPYAQGFTGWMLVGLPALMLALLLRENHQDEYVRPLVASVFLFPLVFPLVIGPLVRAAHCWRLARAVPALGIVDCSIDRGKTMLGRVFEIRFDVDWGGRRSTPSIRALFDSPDDPMLESGRRVYLCVDRGDTRRVSFASDAKSLLWVLFGNL